MKKTFLFAAALVAASWTTAANAVEFEFASAEKAAEILAAQDQYYERLSPAEIAIRMQSQTADKTAADLKAQYVANVLDWSDADKAAWQPVIDAAEKALSPYDKDLPEVVYLIRGTVQIEGGLPHTQANAIVIQTSVQEPSDELLYHETFHVVSRFERAVRGDSLYALLGFQGCELNEPPMVSAMHLTNPDQPARGYYLHIDRGDESFDVVPFLFATKPAFDPNVQGGFPGHFGFGLLKVDVADGVCTGEVDAQGPVMFDVGAVPEFLTALGGNTQYIIHPEETLADNFMFLMTDRQDLPNPEIPEALKTWLLAGQ